jgi:VRR-NUC domain-containing protein
VTAKLMSVAEHRRIVARDMSEDALLAQVRRAALTLGWIVYHTHDSRRSEPGFPDLVLVSPRQGRILWRELKTARGRVSVEQQKWLDALRAAGQDVGVWRPVDLLEERIVAELVAQTAPAPTDTTTEDA